ncbi:hypothetical protein OPIT5_06455 [Opitutaceae bacterium TAV5]|nr:hypothetical protein OPIT5_06455 [Opitutaceae bacterium TAV5]
MTINLTDSHEALINPGMGWVLHYYDNWIDLYGSDLAPSDTVSDFPGLGVCYLRLPWSWLQPEENRFQWSVLDTPAQRWIREGKRIALRVSACEPGEEYATPRWVQEQGAPGLRFTAGRVMDDGACWEPDYGHPLFLEKLEAFVARLAARYDGASYLDFVDIGSYGAWGEGHRYWSTGQPVCGKTLLKHFEIYRRHFRKTRLVVPDEVFEPKSEQDGRDAAADGRGRGRGGAARVKDYCVRNGISLRDDSIGVFPFRKEAVAWADEIFADRPVILESEHYGVGRHGGHWRGGQEYLDAVATYHASYASIHWWPREFLEDNRPLIDAINQRLGYRILPKSITIPDTIRLDQCFTWAGQWRNAGVAPCLPGGFPCLTLKDAAGGIAAVFVDDAFDLSSLPSSGGAARGNVMPGCVLPPFMRAGRHDVYLSVGDRTGCPVIALPLQHGDGEKRYRIGAIEVCPLINGAKRACVPQNGRFPIEDFYGRMSPGAPAPSVSHGRCW